MKTSDFQKNLIAALDYEFKNEKLLETALTHSSIGKSKFPNNQRLEFLGDRVLGLVIAEKLLDDNKEAKEGYIHPQFSALVKKETCAKIAESIDLGMALIMSRSESLSGGRKRVSILGDAMEAIIGAIYLDGGLEQVRWIIHRLWAIALKDVVEASYDPKSSLNEWSQAFDETPPKYEEISRKGPVHAPVFSIEVSLSNGMSATGSSSSKRRAEQFAASNLLKIIDMKKVSPEKKQKL